MQDGGTVGRRASLGRELTQVFADTPGPSGAKVTFADCRAFALGVGRQNRRGDELPAVRKQGAVAIQRVSAAASSRLLRGMQLVAPPVDYQLYARPVGISDMDKIVPLGDGNYAARGGVPGNFRSSAPSLHKVADSEEGYKLWPHTAKMNVRWEGHHIDHGKDDPVHEYVREWTGLTKEERGKHWNTGPYSTLPKTQDLRVEAAGGRRHVDCAWEPPTLFDSEVNLARYGRLGQHARDLHEAHDVRKQRAKLMKGSAAVSAPVLPMRVENEIRQDRLTTHKPRRRKRSDPAFPASDAAPQPALSNASGSNASGSASAFAGQGGGTSPQQMPKQVPADATRRRPGAQSRNLPFDATGPLVDGHQNSFAKEENDFTMDFDLYTRPLDSSQLDKLMRTGVRVVPGTAGPAWDGLTQHMPRTKH